MSNSGEGYWGFVVGLKWLSPSHAPIVDRLARHSARRRDNLADVGRAWLQDSVHDHSLIAQLDILLGNSEHLHTFYHGERILLIKTHCLILTLAVYAFFKHAREKEEEERKARKSKI